MTRGNENVTQDDLYSDLSLEEAQRLLGFLNPDEVHYMDWIGIGMALKGAYIEAGLVVWEDWSATGSKHVEGDCAKRWESFNSTGTTVGTFFHILNKHGYKRGQS